MKITQGHHAGEECEIKYGANDWISVDVKDCEIGAIMNPGSVHITNHEWAELSMGRQLSPSLLHRWSYNPAHERLEQRPEWA